MPAPSWENLDEFLQDETAGGFAIPAVFHLQGVPVPRVVVGIFDDPYLNPQLGEYEVDTSEPRFTCKETDVADVERGDWVQLPDGKLYDIMTGPQSDGVGMAIVRLEPRV